MASAAWSARPWTSLDVRPREGVPGVAADRERGEDLVTHPDGDGEHGPMSAGRDGVGVRRRAADHCRDRASRTGAAWTPLAGGADAAGGRPDPGRLRKGREPMPPRVPCPSQTTAPIPRTRERTLPSDARRRPRCCGPGSAMPRGGTVRRHLLLAPCRLTGLLGSGKDRTRVSHRLLGEVDILGPVRHRRGPRHREGSDHLVPDDERHR